MTDTSPAIQTTKKPTEVTITRAKGRPMLSWVGKKPLGRVTAFPAQAVERFSAVDAAQSPKIGEADWSQWPKHLTEQGLQGGLLYHGDNKEVLATCWPTAFAARSS